MLIKLTALSKKYRSRIRNGQFVMQNLHLDIFEGEIFGFLGPNGAGKSTVIKILMNFIRPSTGRAFIKEIPVSDPCARQSVGYLPETPCFYDHLTAEEILTFGGLAAGMQRDLTRERIDRLLSRLDLAHAKKQRLSTYSKGMIQRIGLAFALIHDPELCILDEPMSGLDPMGRRLVADLILDMRREGKTVFFSSHILSDIQMLCDRVGILNRGRLLYRGSVDNLMTEAESLERAFIKIIEEDERKNNVADLADS